MKLSNEMVIDAPVDHAWTLLTDLERIAPSMPGAVLEEISGDDFTGTVSVKVGPIAMKYRGIARFQELDPAARRAVISARGTDASGQGTVNAVITAQLTPEGARTRVLVDTDLNIEGRLAQFGRGGLADVSARLMTQFVRNLDATLARPAAEPAPAGVAAAPSAKSGDSIDLVATIGPVVARRAIPVLIGMAAGMLAMRWLMNRSR